MCLHHFHTLNHVTCFLICVIFLHSSSPLERTRFEYQDVLSSSSSSSRAIPLLSAEEVGKFVGSRTILIDTHGNYRGGRQQTVVVQGQHKTINHNSSFCPPERTADHAQPKSNSANMCLHICLHQPLACCRSPWLKFALPWRSNKDSFSLV